MISDKRVDYITKLNDVLINDYLEDIKRVTSFICNIQTLNNWQTLKYIIYISN